MPWAFFFAILFLVTIAHAQTTTTAPEAASTNPATSSEEEKQWEFSLSANTYLISGGRDFVQPTFTADHGWLHLEARYNYEGLDTGSAWVGYNFSFGDQLTLDVTPMIGGVFGHTYGVAPGYRAALNWWKLELYTEGEYVFDTSESSDSFFYTWSELTLAPVEWFRFGLVIQRTKDYETDFDIQHGLLVGFSYERLSFTTYLFNPEDNPVLVLGVGFEF